MSSYLARRNPRLDVVVVCVVGADWSRRSLLYSLTFVGLAFGGFSNLREFHAPLFSDLFPRASKVRLDLAEWGATLLGEGYAGWSAAWDDAIDLCCFRYFLLLQLATGS